MNKSDLDIFAICATDGSKLCISTPLSNNQVTSNASSLPLISCKVKSYSCNELATIDILSSCSTSLLPDANIFIATINKTKMIKNFFI